MADAEQHDTIVHEIREAIREARMRHLTPNGKLTLANVVIAVFTAGLITLSGWMLGNLVELKEFAAKGDRVTPVELALMKDEILAEVPPAHFEKKVDGLAEDLELVRRAQVTIIEKLARIEERMTR